MQPPKLSKGFKIGVYEILDEKPIGIGSFGHVFKAWRPDVKNYYAVKVFYPKDNTESRNPANFAKALEQFERDKQMLVDYKGDNIVRIDAFGTLTDLNGEEFPYFVMEYIEETLDNKTFPFDQVVDLIAQVCDALTFLHENKIIHRDIKPSNLLLHRKKIVKVTDFGTAKLLSNADQDSSFTVVYSEFYSPPEQTLKKKLDETADIYATAKTLYKLLTGAHAPALSPITTLPGIFKKESYHDDLLNLLKNATADDPKDRPYKTATAFKKALLDIAKKKSDITDVPEEEGGKKTALDDDQPSARDDRKRNWRPLLLILLLAAAIYALKMPEVREHLHQAYQTVRCWVVSCDDPVKAAEHFAQGRRWFDAQKWQEARSEFEKAAALDGKNADYYRYLGYVNSELQRGEETIAAFEEAVKLKPDDVPLLILLGKAYMQFGYPDEAISTFEKALQFKPDDPEIMALIELVRRKQ